VNTRSRLLAAAASILLIGMFVWPIWRIDLTAPQYPEGLGLEIRISTIAGLTPYDLDRINNLNHYIGMKAIEPEAIPELAVMPWLVGGLIAMGLLVAALGRRPMLYAWTTAFATVAIAGVADFWRWSYDYGHNLDFENAIIKVPGMSYQPPLIGTKQLLNFTATSWPGVGGSLAFLAMALAITAVVLAWRTRTARPVVAAALTLAACGGGKPRPIAYDEATCASCHMGITDRRFGAELVTSKGKVLSFDSIECLATFYVRHRDVARSVWVTDYARPGTLVPADSAHYVRGGETQSPMGVGIVAYADSGLAARAVARGGERLGWSEVVTLVEQTGAPHAALHLIERGVGASR